MPQKYELFLDKNKKVKLAANDQGELFFEANGNVVKINDEGLKLGKRDQGGADALAAVGLSEAEVAAIAQENGYSAADRITEIDLTSFFGNMRYSDLTWTGSTFTKNNTDYFIELNDYIDTPGFYRGVLEIFIAGRNDSNTPDLTNKSALHRLYFTYVNDGRDGVGYFTRLASDNSGQMYTGESPISYKAFKKYVTDNTVIPYPTYGDFKNSATEASLLNANYSHNIWANSAANYNAANYTYGYNTRTNFGAIFYYDGNPRTYQVDVFLGVDLGLSSDRIQIRHSIQGRNITYTNPIYDYDLDVMTYGPNIDYKINPNYGIYNYTYPTIKGKITLERVTDASGFGFDNLNAQP